MPGKSKKGGGLEVGSAYKMKRGAAPKFKDLGSSPAKQEHSTATGDNFLQREDSWFQQGLTWFNKNLNPAYFIFSRHFTPEASIERKQRIQEYYDKQKGIYSPHEVTYTKQPNESYKDFQERIKLSEEKRKKKRE